MEIESKGSASTGSQVTSTSGVSSEMELRINGLYDMKDSGNKQIVSDSLKLLDEIPDPLNMDARIPRKQRARLFYLRGKLLDVQPEYNKLAEECLSKAVKLSPPMVDAWNCLAHCFWKKGDLMQAKTCLDRAYQLKENKDSLRLLSMLLRKLNVGGDSEEQQTKHAEDVDKSVELAKKAVQMDVKDPVSWYILGNAYLSSFFDVSHEKSAMNSALRAYQLASADVKASTLPDLHFNRATLFRYQEDYEKAIESFRRAHAIDNEWDAEIQNTMQLVLRVYTAITKKGFQRPKRLTSMIESIKVPNVFARDKVEAGKGEEKETRSLESVEISDLKDGVNDEKMISLKVLSDIPNEEPQMYVGITTTGQCVAMSIYNAKASVIKVNDDITIVSPILRHVWMMQLDSEMIKYISIVAESVDHIVLNGKPCGELHRASPNVYFGGQ